MNPDLRVQIEHYIESLFVAPDPALTQGLADADAAGLPQIQVAPNHGKLLYLLTKMSGARRVLEIGTLGGYSTTWFARALPDGGTVTTLEVERTHADVARKNLDRAGVGGRVTIQVGPAAETMQRMIREREPPFDLIFIDADKPGYPAYLTWAVALSRPGTLIIADNVVRQGAVANAKSRDRSVLGVRQFNEAVAANPRLTATIIQTVGAKGYDGFAAILVGAPG